jgi:hypothetical protein
MATFHLVAREDQFDSAPGLGLRDIPAADDYMADRDGTLTAHDVLEHVNGPRAIGTIDDELEAMGAAWYVRGQHGRIRRDYGGFNGPHADIAADVSRMAVEFLNGAHVAVAAIPRTRACDADADIDDILTRAEESARAECRHDAAPYDGERLALYFKAARARMRLGYRKAARKYRDVNVCALFWHVADAVGRAVKSGDLFAGAEFRLHVDMRACRATCEEIYPDFD